MVTGRVFLHRRVDSLDDVRREIAYAGRWLQVRRWGDAYRSVGPCSRQSLRRAAQIMCPTRAGMRPDDGAGIMWHTPDRLACVSRPPGRAPDAARGAPCPISMPCVFVIGSMSDEGG